MLQGQGDAQGIKCLLCGHKQVPTLTNMHTHLSTTHTNIKRNHFVCLMSKLEQSKSLHRLSSMKGLWVLNRYSRRPQLPKPCLCASCIEMAGKALEPPAGEGKGGGGQGPENSSSRVLHAETSPLSRRVEVAQ